MSGRQSQLLQQSTVFSWSLKESLSPAWGEGGGEGVGDRVGEGAGEGVGEEVGEGVVEGVGQEGNV